MPCAGIEPATPGFASQRSSFELPGHLGASGERRHQIPVLLAVTMCGHRSRRPPIRRSLVRKRPSARCDLCAVFNVPLRYGIGAAPARPGRGFHDLVSWEAMRKAAHLGRPWCQTKMDLSSDHSPRRGRHIAIEFRDGFHRYGRAGLNATAREIPRTLQIAFMGPGFDSHEQLSLATFQKTQTKKPQRPSWGVTAEATIARTRGPCQGISRESCRLGGAWPHRPIREAACDLRYVRGLT